MEYAPQPHDKNRNDHRYHQYSHDRHEDQRKQKEHLKGCQESPPCQRWILDCRVLILIRQPRYKLLCLDKIVLWYQ